MRNRIITVLLSVVIALGLWIYVVTVVNPASDRRYNSIPVTLQGESVLRERSLMVTTLDLPNVSMNLKGNRTELDKLNSSNIVLFADVSKIYEEGTHEIRLTPSYPGDVSANSISVQDMKPTSITIQVEKWASKTVPVEVAYTGTLPKTYIADKENKILEQEEVSISGPESVIKKIAVAQIEVNLDDRVENINEAFQYKLCQKNGKGVDAQLVTTNVESVTLRLRIARMKEVPLHVSVKDGGGATAETVKIKIEPETIGISGSDSLLEDIEAIDLGTIDLNEIPRDTELTFPIKLIDGVINESGVDEAKVSVSFPSLATKTVTITKFKTVNVPQGLKPKLITKALEVQVRGPKEVIDDVTSADFVASVDFANEKAGPVKLKTKITSITTNVGVVGNYTVSANLSENG